MSDEMPPAFWRGIEQFNHGDYYSCHDTLEALWVEAEEPDRSFFQGILQLAVALYHLTNQNQRGAMILLGEGSHRLQRYRPNYGGVDVDTLLDLSGQFLITLQQTSFNRHIEVPGDSTQAQPWFTIPLVS
jgi:predicted metal-dependent hydrolase